MLIILTNEINIDINLIVYKCFLGAISDLFHDQIIKEQKEHTQERPLKILKSEVYICYTAKDNTRKQHPDYDAIVQCHL